jgi:hypothetical protein
MPNLKREFHPLFMPEPDGPKDFEPEEFTKILVKRLAAYGPLARGERSPAQAMRLYTPEELDTLERFMQTFGGGSYEVRALMDNGRMYARRWLNVPGDSKSLVPDLDGPGGTAPPPLPAPGQAAAGVDPMTALLISLMGESRREGAQMMQAMMQMQAQQTTAMMGVIAAVVQGSGNKESLADMMRGFAELAKSSQPPTPLQTGADAIKDTLATAKLIREEVAANTPAAKEPEETTSQIIRTVGEMAIPIVSQVLEKQAANAAAVATAPLFPMVPG